MEHNTGLDLTIMDRRANPGIDFYRYATGRYPKRHPIPAEYNQWGTWEEVIERNAQTLHEILKKCADQTKKGQTAPGSEAQLLGQFYLSGMNAEQINAEGAASGFVWPPSKTGTRGNRADR
jgi:putative endopeptidase